MAADLKNHLKKSKKLFPFERLFLNFMSKEVRTDQLSGPKEAVRLCKLKTKILLIPRAKLSSGAYDRFDFINWIESKIQNKPFSEIKDQ